jgi:hypothetical protein
MNHTSNKDDLQIEDLSGTIDSAETTLRLIASLPAPEGLTDRVQAGLRAAPNLGRVLPWRGPLRSVGGWMHNGWIHGSVARGAAAAAIVCVVAGGGWRIYSRVQPSPAANVIVMPQRVSPAAGFSQAGARRVPDTLQGPVLTHPVADNPERSVEDKALASPKPVAGGAPARRKKTASRIAVLPVQ